MLRFGYTGYTLVHNSNVNVAVLIDLTQKRVCFFFVMVLFSNQATELNRADRFCNSTSTSIHAAPIDLLRSLSIHIF